MKIMTDSPIRFPGLFGDWAITISSKAIDIGNGIYWYGILIALGMLVALWWCMRQRTKYGIREDDLIDGLLWGIPSAIVGARLYYVLFYLSEFKDHEGHFSWSKAIAIWDGGLAIYGGVIAVVIVAIILCRSRHIKLGADVDLLTHRYSPLPAGSPLPCPRCVPSAFSAGPAKSPAPVHQWPKRSPGWTAAR